MQISKLFHWKATPTRAFNEFLYEILRIFLISENSLKFVNIFCWGNEFSIYGSSQSEVSRSVWKPCRREWLSVRNETCRLDYEQGGRKKDVRRTFIRRSSNSTGGEKRVIICTLLYMLDAAGKPPRSIWFLPRCMQCRRGIAMRILSVRLSVRPSVTRVIPDKTEERSVQICIPYERTFFLVFWEEEWLVGGDPFYLKFWVSRPLLERIRRFSTNNRS